MTVHARTRRLGAAVRRAASRLDDTALDLAIEHARHGQVDAVLASLARVLPIGELTGTRGPRSARCLADVAPHARCSACDRATRAHCASLRKCKRGLISVW